MPIAGKPVAAYLLTHLDQGGISDACWVIRPEKQDIPQVYGAQHGAMRLHYLPTQRTPSSLHTLDVAYPLIKDHFCALGYPDIVFPPCSAYARLRDSLISHAADACLGLFPTLEPSRVDIVALNGSHITHIDIKPSTPVDSHLTWAPAIWTPVFTDFLHSYVAQLDADNLAREIQIGDAINAAITAGLTVVGEQLAKTPVIDVGTPHGLKQASRVVRQWTHSDNPK